MQLHEQNLQVVTWHTNAQAIIQQDCILCVKDADERINLMTLSWKTIGLFWGEPCVMISLAEIRYTNELLQNNAEDFSLSFSNRWQKALEFLGSHSGRHGDKVEGSGLSLGQPIGIKSPNIQGAEHVYECRLLDSAKTNFACPAELYIGKIVNALAI